MQLGHDQIKQLVGRIALQVAERLRIGIAIPDRADIIRRVADKPAVVIVTCRTGLTGDIHRIAQRDTAAGTVVHDILHHLGHDVGSRFAKHDLTLLTVVGQQQVAGTVIHIEVRMALVVNAIVGKRRIGSSNITHGHAEVQLTERQRCKTLVGIAAAAAVLAVINQVVKAETVFEIIIRFVDCQILEHLHRHGVDRSLNRAVDRRQSLIDIRQVLRIRRVAVEPQRRIVIDAAVGDDALFQRGAVDRQRLQ